MNKEITLKINGTEKTFYSTEDGYFCLNEVWEDFDLKASQHPAEWLEEVDYRPVELGHAYDLSEYDAGIWATKSLLLMYAGWVLIGTAMDPFHWRRNGPTPFVP